MCPLQHTSILDHFDYCPIINIDDDDDLTSDEEEASRDLQQIREEPRWRNLDQNSRYWLYYDQPPATQYWYTTHHPIYTISFTQEVISVMRAYLLSQI